MWKAARVAVALAVLLLFIAGFVNLANNEPAAWEHAVERVQFVPALLGTLSGVAGAALALAVLVLITLVFGRVYCSFLCPLGILQDIVIRLRRWADGLRGRVRKGAAIRYAPPVPYVRYVVLGVVAVSMLGGAALLLAWLDPYTIAARFAAGVVNPLAATVADALPGQDTAAPAWGRYGVLLGVVGLFIAIPLVMAWWRGRLYCNTICPVGALLGLLSRRPLLRLGMDPAGCVLCGNCLKACKANCIDLKNHRVDTSRCVNCYDCVSACSHGLRPKLTNPFRSAPAPKQKPRKQPTPAAPDTSRRAFLGAMACGVPALMVSCREKSPEELSANPAELGDNEAPATTPPGSRNVERFLDRCTGCGLCITACPTHVLQPSRTQHGLRGVMKPYMDFTQGFCNFDCNICSTVCPEGAILPIALAEKKQTQIALADFDRSYCIVQQNHTECGACTEHCPTKALYTKEEQFPACDSAKCYACHACVETCPQKAISIAEAEDGSAYVAIDNKKCIGCGKCARVCPSGAMTVQRLLIPALAPELCIGCGACTYACPVRPRRAMQLTARARHLPAQVHREAPAENPVAEDDFPF